MSSRRTAGRSGAALRAVGQVEGKVLAHRFRPGVGGWGDAAGTASRREPRGTSGLRTNFAAGLCERHTIRAREGPSDRDPGADPAEPSGAVPDAPAAAVAALRDALDARLDDLADAATQLILAEIPAYRDATPALRDDVRAHVLSHLRISLSTFSEATAGHPRGAPVRPRPRRPARRPHPDRRVRQRLLRRASASCGRRRSPRRMTTTPAVPRWCSRHTSRATSRWPPPMPPRSTSRPRNSWRPPASGSAATCSRTSSPACRWRPARAWTPRGQRGWSPGIPCLVVSARRDADSRRRVAAAQRGHCPRARRRRGARPADGGPTRQDRPGRPGPGSRRRWRAPTAGARPAPARRRRPAAGDRREHGGQRAGPDRRRLPRGGARAGLPGLGARRRRADRDERVRLPDAAARPHGEPAHSRSDPGVRRRGRPAGRCAHRHPERVRRLRSQRHAAPPSGCTSTSTPPTTGWARSPSAPAAICTGSATSPRSSSPRGSCRRRGRGLTVAGRRGLPPVAPYNGWMNVLPSVSERSVQVEGIRLHVRESGDGQPVLLINGIGAHVGMWAPMERFLPGMRVIAFDAPGTGRSATSAFPLSLELLSQLTERLLDRLGYDQVDVLGYSFGGLIAQYLARRAPTRVRRLVLAATTPGWGGVPGSMWTLSQMATPLRYYWRPYYEAVIGQLMGGRARDDPEFVRRHGAARQLRPPNRPGLHLAAAGAGRRPWEPCVVTRGEDRDARARRRRRSGHAPPQRLAPGPAPPHCAAVRRPRRGTPAAHGRPQQRPAHHPELPERSQRRGLPRLARIGGG